MINCVQCSWEDIRFEDREGTIGSGKMEPVVEFGWSGSSDVVGKETTL